MIRDYKRTVLMVDDNEQLLEEYIEIFNDNGIQLLIAKTGAQAIELGTKNHFDVGIVDLRLPDFSGVELVEKLRDSSPDAVFLLITAYASTETAIKSMHRNIFDYVQKPFSPEELLLSVKKGFLLRDARVVNRQQFEDLIKEKGLLQAKVLVLEQFNELFMERENKVFDLRNEVNSLLARLNEPPKYVI